MADENEKIKRKCLLEYLRSSRLDQHGSVILSSDVRSVLGLEYPEIGTKREFDAVTIAEMAAVDYVRNILINEGKYLAQRNGDYRILLPSENARQIEQYMNHADNKLRRAQRLSKNTPRAEGHQNDNVAARLHLKREAIKSRVTMGKCEEAA